MVAAFLDFKICEQLTKHSFAAFMMMLNYHFFLHVERVEGLSVLDGLAHSPFECFAMNSLSCAPKSNGFPFGISNRACGRRRLHTVQMVQTPTERG
jgi:hypothetical protein